MSGNLAEDTFKRKYRIFKNEIMSENTTAIAFKYLKAVAAKVTALGQLGSDLTEHDKYCENLLAAVTGEVDDWVMVTFFEQTWISCKHLKFYRNSKQHCYFHIIEALGIGYNEFFTAWCWLVLSNSNSDEALDNFKKMLFSGTIELGNLKNILSEIVKANKLVNNIAIFIRDAPGKSCHCELIGDNKDVDTWYFELRDDHLTRCLTSPPQPWSPLTTADLRRNIHRAFDSDESNW